jgi:hypothetical protein
LGQLLTNYTNSLGYDLNDCQLNTLLTTWYVDIRLDDTSVVQLPFFNGVGYSNTGLATPTSSQWDVALSTALDTLETYGYDYYLTTNNTVVVYNSICSENQTGINFKLNVGIDFNILCPTYTKSLYE